jgi:hypothetical protein
MAGMHTLPLELLERVLDYCITKPSDLSTRLVCRGFFNASWRSLASCIDQHATFDMRSYKSMMYLKAISEHEELARRVSGLTLTSFYVPDLDTTTEFDRAAIHNRGTGTVAHEKSEAVIRAIKPVQDEASAWDPVPSWELFGHRLHQSEQPWYPDHMVDFLAECFRRCPKLSEATLIHKHCTTIEGGKTIHWLPHRYATIFKDNEIELSKVPLAIWEAFEAAADSDTERMMALDRFIKALSTAGKSLTALEIPTETLRTDHFRVCTSRSALRQVLGRVEELTLRSRDLCHMSGSGGTSEVQYPLSKENMPYLRHLILDIGIAPLGIRGNCTTHSFNLPQITHLTMRSGEIRDIGPYNSSGTIVDPNPSLTHLMQRCRASLKQVTMVNLVDGDWVDLLNLCQDIGLGRLDIELEEGLIDALEFSLCSIPNKEQLYRAAKTVALSPGSARLLLPVDWDSMEN